MEKTEIHDGEVIETYWFCVDFIDTQDDDFRALCMRDDDCAITPDSNGVYIQVNHNDSEERQLDSLTNEILRAIFDNCQEPGEIEVTLEIMKLLRIWTKLNGYARRDILDTLSYMETRPEYTKTDIVPFPNVRPAEDK